MPKYNKNSVFAVSSAGTIPNRVDDLIFFEDINKNELTIWNEFERIMATGDYNAAHTYIEGYAEIHGYFGDLYNLMVNRIKAVQDFLVLNEANINNASGAFSSFKKPEIFIYQEEADSPKNILKDQVWIGPKGYFDEIEIKESINKLKMGFEPKASADEKHCITDAGLTLDIDELGYLTINGTADTARAQVRIGITVDGIQPTNTDVWSYWSYYVSGSVKNYTSGEFEFYPVGGGQILYAPSSRTANMHANFIGLGPATKWIELVFRNGMNEVYDNLKVGFMVCKTAETSPNQKYVKCEGA